MWHRGEKTGKKPENIWEVIHRGGYPELWNGQKEWSAFYADYVRTYVERDVRDLAAVQDLNAFSIADCRSGKNRTGHKLFRHSLGNREGCGNRKKLDLHPGGVRNRLSAGAVYLRPFKTGNPLSQAVFPGYRTRVLSHQMAGCGEPGLWRNERACFRNICGQ